ncbi:Xeroderma pigmentosum G I-region, partial [Rhizoctonia solani]
MKTVAFITGTLAITGLVSAGVAAPLEKRAQPKGIGVSGYQGNVDWAAQKSAGITFAYIKATEGTGYTNPYFNQQYSGSYNVGIVRGSYHFARPDISSGATQANYFLAHGGTSLALGLLYTLIHAHSQEGGQLMERHYQALLILNNPYGTTCYGLSAASMVSWIKDFSNTYQSKTGRYPTIYTTTDWWQTCTGNSAAFGSTNALWIARYASAVGTLPAGWAYYTFWQYSSSPLDQGSQCLIVALSFANMALQIIGTGMPLDWHVTRRALRLRNSCKVTPAVAQVYPYQYKHNSIFRKNPLVLGSLAVDGYVWLHRGAYACAIQLVKGQYTTKYVDYAMHRVRMLRHHGITPYIVFDGGPLPAKRGTEKDREEKRSKSLAQAQLLEAQGKGNEAYEYYKKCVDITPQMAYQLIKALRAEGVSYVVAPYEADAQMAYLEREGIVDGIITEDSDLVVFGCRNLLFKLGQDGSCVNVRREDLAAVTSLNLVGWSDKELRWMAILSGCDYIDSLPGLGLKTAYKLLRKWKTAEKASNMTQRRRIRHEFGDRIAELAFLHQRVYDPASQRLTHLGSPPADEGWDESKDAFVGDRDLPPDVAKKIAEGDFCPILRDTMIDIMPAFQPKPRKGKTISTEVPSNASIKDSQKSISSFFGAATISSHRKKHTPLPKFVSVKGSGRSSLSAQLVDKTPPEEDWEVMEIEGPTRPNACSSTTSRFFGDQSTPPKSRTLSGEAEERKRKRADSFEEITTPRAARTLIRRWSGNLVDLTMDEENSEPDAGGSIVSRSASPDTFSLLQDLSSPVQPDRTSRSKSPESISGDLSSPESTRKQVSHPRLQPHLSIGSTEPGSPDQDLPIPTPMLTYKLGTSLQGGSSKHALPPNTTRQKSVLVDLREVFSQESVSEISASEEGPWTPSDPLVGQVAVNEGVPDLDDTEYLSDDEKHEAEAAERRSRVARGWEAKYGFKVVKGRKSLPYLSPAQSTAPPSPPQLLGPRPTHVFQPLGMPKSRPKARGRKSEPALRTEIVIDDDDEDFLLGSKVIDNNDIIISSPERAAERFNRFKCPT